MTIRDFERLGTVCAQRAALSKVEKSLNLTGSIMENTTNIITRNITMDTDKHHPEDFMILAKSYTIYKISK